MSGRRFRKMPLSVSERIFLVLAVVVVIPSLAVELAREYPVAVAGVVLLVLAAVAGWVYWRVLRSRRLAEFERNVAVTDGMSGPEFERYVARLMCSSGCRQVEVSGKAGDMGADVTGYAPDGRRLVVQCKRYTGALGSPDVQRFAGTARTIHKADVALLVTTGRPSGPALDVARRCGITVVDRLALARWATTWVPPIDGWPAPRRQAARPVTADAPVVAPRQARPVAAPPPASAAPASDWWVNPGP